MRVLLDEQLDWRVKHLIDPEHEVRTVTDRGWTGLKNGELLTRAAQDFDAFVTMDGGIEHQQNLAAVSLVIILVRARTNRLADVASVAPELNRLLRIAKPGRPHVAGG